ncbi:hypothetical protein FQA39_LY15301 [Lamprigera yunnana]|nr:hypothetical protein FQA39_LY15301 [Lamprigera yunnana]
MSKFPPVPDEVKHITHYMKVADEHDRRNVVVSYWSRMYACEAGMHGTVTKSPELTHFLISVMNWLEDAKKEHADIEGIINSAVATKEIEEYALQLFNYADGLDRAEKFGKNVVKAFYTSSILMDVLQQFGQLSQDMFDKRKYAKWKAAYIHHCLKIGERPLPGPRVLKYSDEEDGLEDDEYMIYRDPSTPAAPDETVHQEEVLPDPVNSVPNVMPEVNIFPSATNVIPNVPPAADPVPNRVSPTSSTASAILPTATLGPEQMEKAQKYCKWAGSALAYDDVNTAVDNLEKALALLRTGRDC